ncbi:MAG TPA: SusE domain-containing protein [Flavobacterium sp.]|nr:SusE domain-containing protein [Flavobacterium sp.]
MKNIIKSVIALTLFAGFWSCEDEQDLKFVSPDASFSILTPTSGDGVVLDQAHPSNPGLVLSWEDMDYGTPTAVTYTIQVATNGTDFAEPIDVATTTNNFISIDSATLNGAALGAGLTPFTEGALDVRVMSTVGTPAAENAYSNVINYLVTSYSSELPKVYVVGGFQGASGYGSDWTPSSAVPLASSAFGETDYEGYVFMNVASPEYKILPTNESFDGDYGDDGSFSGILVQTGESNITAGGPGYYRVKADTAALTYSAQPTSWGIIGSATPTGWDSDTDMIYDPVAKTFSISMNLSDGNKIKFRANDLWDLNYGDTGADGSLNEGGDDIPVPAGGGNFTITLDLSHPRAYSYTITPN